MHSYILIPAKIANGAEHDLAKKNVLVIKKPPLKSSTRIKSDSKKGHGQYTAVCIPIHAINLIFSNSELVIYLIIGSV